MAHVYSSRSSVGAHDRLTCRQGRREHIPPIDGVHEHLPHDQDTCKYFLKGYSLRERLLHGLGAHEYLMRGPDHCGNTSRKATASANIPCSARARALTSRTALSHATASRTDGARVHLQKV